MHDTKPQAPPGTAISALCFRKLLDMERARVKIAIEVRSERVFSLSQKMVNRTSKANSTLYGLTYRVPMTTVTVYGFTRYLFL